MIIFVFVLLLVLISGIYINDAFAELVEHKDPKFEFSIKYPVGFHVDNEVIELGPNKGYYDNYFSIVYFTDNPKDITTSIEVTLLKNDIIARNYQGQQYIDQVTNVMEENCYNADFTYDSYACSNFEVTLAKKFKHNGYDAYRFKQTYTEHYIDKTSLELQSIHVDIVDGSDVWTINTVTTKETYPKVSSMMIEVIKSFSLTANQNVVDNDSDNDGIPDSADSCPNQPETFNGFLDGDGCPDTSPIKGNQKPVSEEVQIPGWIKSNAGWWADGSIDDEAFVQGIQFLIKEDVLNIPPTPQGSGSGSNEIPSWIKSNAGWWADGSIDDEAFVQGIQFLIKEGIMRIQ